MFSMLELSCKRQSEGANRYASSPKPRSPQTLSLESRPNLKLTLKRSSRSCFHLNIHCCRAETLRPSVLMPRSHTHHLTYTRIITLTPPSRCVSVVSNLQPHVQLQLPGSHFKTPVAPSGDGEQNLRHFFTPSLRRLFLSV